MGSLGPMLAYRRLALHRRVIVNLRSGSAISGVLLRTRGPLLELGNAELLEAGRTPIPLDGRQLVERANVEFVQVVGEV